MYEIMRLKIGYFYANKEFLAKYILSVLKTMMIQIRNFNYSGYI